MTPNQTETSYEAVQYAGDGEWWTVRKITEVDFAKVEGQWAAEALIAKLKKADASE